MNLTHNSRVVYVQNFFYIKQLGCLFNIRFRARICANKLGSWMGRRTMANADVTFRREYAGCRRRVSARVNFRAGSVRQSLWIKRATPAFTFTIVVNYSEFFPRRFYPDHRLASLDFILLSLSPSLLFPFAGTFFSFYLSVSSISSVSSSAVPQSLHLPQFDGCASSSGSSNVLFILFIESTRHSTKLYSRI